MTTNANSRMTAPIRVPKVGTAKLALDDPNSVSLEERLRAGRGEHEKCTVQSDQWLLRLEWSDGADDEPAGWWLTVAVWLGWWAAWPWVQASRLLSLGADVHEAVERVRRVLADGVSLAWLRNQLRNQLAATSPGGPADWLSDPVTEITERQARAVDLRLADLLVAVDRLPGRLRLAGIVLLPCWTGTPRQLAATVRASEGRLP